uniref:Fe2OG dioxygenase domain-containing protein n=1 Tax=Grammatophora oceanica TaxID=210454 RepID=A0A7S1YAX2_9STRA
MLMAIRKRAHSAAEEAMGLCPGTLKIDYTHFTQKRAGGTHDTHSDNCFALYASEDRPVPGCDESRHHAYPFTNRVVSSILYLNEDFEGGEFYWADQRTGEPKTVVRPKPGRMMVFSSGAESLHGALPVTDRKEEEPSRRLALAMWFGTDASREEAEPVFNERVDEMETEL